MQCHPPGLRGIFRVQQTQLVLRASRSIHSCAHCHPIQFCILRLVAGVISIGLASAPVRDIRPLSYDVGKVTQRYRLDSKRCQLTVDLQPQFLAPAPPVFSASRPTHVVQSGNHTPMEPAHKVFDHECRTASTNLSFGCHIKVHTRFQRIILTSCNPSGFCKS